MRRDNYMRGFEDAARGLPVAESRDNDYLNGYNEGRIDRGRAERMAPKEVKRPIV